MNIERGHWLTIFRKMKRISLLYPLNSLQSNARSVHTCSVSSVSRCWVQKQKSSMLLWSIRQTSEQNLNLKSRCSCRCCLILIFSWRAHFWCFHLIRTWGSRNVRNGSTHLFHKYTKVQFVQCHAYCSFSLKCLSKVPEKRFLNYWMSGTHILSYSFKIIV